MPDALNRQEVLMPGGLELTQRAEPYLSLSPEAHLLSVACGTGEIEIYLAQKHGCRVTGIDVEEAFIDMARGKATERKLEGRVAFETGDGNALPFPDASFDALFCSGALCAFFENGVREFHRVLKPGACAAVIEVVWLQPSTPPSVLARWSDEDTDILTVQANCAAFQRQGFRILYGKGYREPAWWDAYYEDRGPTPQWCEEHAHYRQDQDHFGVGLFVMQKEAGIPALAKSRPHALAHAEQRLPHPSRQAPSTKPAS